MPLPASEQDRRAALIRTLRSARPSHTWKPGKAGCTRCPTASPFKTDPGSHPYVIEEQL